MSGREFFVGKTPILEQKKNVSGAYVEVEGEVFYRIENHNAMRPFFMTVVSSSDHWLFIHIALNLYNLHRHNIYST